MHMSKVINWTSTIPDSAQGRLGIAGWENFQRPTFPDDYIIEPTPHRDDLDNTHDHYHCPANKSWMKNRYTLYTPIDIHFRIDSKTKMIGSDKCNGQDQFNRLFQVRNGWWDGEYPEVEIQYLHLFWTKHKKVWVEFTGHPSQHNFEVVSGHFPISNWLRPMTIGMVIKTFDKDILIRRGEPLCTVRFFDNMPHKTSDFTLERSIPEGKDMVRRLWQDREFKDWQPFKSWSIIMNRLNKDEEGKCPFQLPF